MISFNRTIYFLNDLTKDGRPSYVGFSEKIDERTAMTRLVFDTLVQTDNVTSLWDDSLGFRLEDRNERIEGIGFSGYAHYLRPLFLVTKQYIHLRQVIGKPFTSSSEFTNRELTEVADVTGEQYGQPWGDLAWRYPLKLAIIRALCPEAGPVHVHEDLINLPLDELLKKMFNAYDAQVAEAALMVSKIPVA